MNSQLSGEVPVALLTRIAIVGLKDDRQFNRADNVFRVTPNFFAASVTVKPRGLMTSSLKTSPGCVGFRFCIVSITPIIFLMIISVIYLNGIISIKLKGDTPTSTNPY